MMIAPPCEHQRYVADPATLERRCLLPRWSMGARNILRTPVLVIGNMASIALICPRPALFPEAICHT
jgi:hypothetical protein